MNISNLNKNRLTSECLPICVAKILSAYASRASQAPPL